MACITSNNYCIIILSFRRERWNELTIDLNKSRSVCLSSYILPYRVPCGNVFRFIFIWVPNCPIYYSRAANDSEKASKIRKYAIAVFDFDIFVSRKECVFSKIPGSESSKNPKMFHEKNERLGLQENGSCHGRKSLESYERQINSVKKIKLTSTNARESCKVCE